RAPVRAPPSLDQELASMQRARAALGRGDASAALAELDRFGRGPGWRQLAVEARLLRIEALARAGRVDEARNLARRFVEQNPNNPLVDRARTFIAPAASSGVEKLSEENHP
ncbi:MAG TPA: tetratricopeptide repeat protein, partial [Polyangiaceae bacterium]|nr:tetratricopeptide repeat protein [Polyangiaceae bacterium]